MCLGIQITASLFAFPCLADKYNTLWHIRTLLEFMQCLQIPIHWSHLEVLAIWLRSIILCAHQDSELELRMHAMSSNS